MRTWMFAPALALAAAGAWAADYTVDTDPCVEFLQTFLPVLNPTLFPAPTD